MTHATCAEADPQAVVSVSIAEHQPTDRSQPLQSARQELAKELHDGLGQYLTCLRYGLSALIETDSVAQMKNGIKHLHNIANAAQAEMQRIVTQMRPLALADMGLIPAIQRFVCDLTSLFEIEIDFESNVEAEHPLSEQLESTIYRLTQETLHNVVKHSNAKHVVLEIRVSAEEIIFRCADNGTGIDSTNLIQDRHGISSMRERVEAMQGIFRIRNLTPSGTEVLAIFHSQESI
jgi:two-component system, NarL family, sensor kinase